jgi:predicted nucleic acid-binding protein
LNNSWVIDSSIGISWVYKAQATPEADKLLTFAASGALIVVPSLWYTEMGNVLLTLQRRGKLTAAERRSAITNLDAILLSVDDGSPSAALHATSDLAEAHRLTLYDATYLEVALRRGIGLASRDDSLNRAAKACGVSTL